jgi:D-alanyl-D-alanine carboxypeptidase
MTKSARAELLRDLGISADYGRDPFRPEYKEAVELVESDANIIGKIQRLCPSTAKDWTAMKEAALKSNIELMMVSGYRSIEYQASLLRRKLDSGLAIEAILEVNAAPGFSQHHTGKTLDLATPGTRPLTESFDTTRAFDWLVNNAASFGFRMPYGRGNSFGFMYEPWHWTQLDI